MAQLSLDYMISLYKRSHSTSDSRCSSLITSDANLYHKHKAPESAECLSAQISREEHRAQSVREMHDSDCALARGPDERASLREYGWRENDGQSGLPWSF